MDNGQSIGGANIEGKRIGYRDWHDKIGHFATGLGFDRHGEFSNDLAIIRLIDLAEKDGAISKEEAQFAKTAALSLDLISGGRFDVDDEPDIGGTLLEQTEPLISTGQSPYYDIPDEVAKLLDNSGMRYSQPHRVFHGDIDEATRLVRTRPAQSGMASKKKPINTRSFDFRKMMFMQNEDRQEYLRRQRMSDVARGAESRMNRGSLGRSGMASKREPKMDIEDVNKDFYERHGYETPDGDGDCYPSAIDTARKFIGMGYKPEDVKVVHGEPLGTGGDAEGIRYGHAWVEIDLGDGKFLVVDESNGNNIVVMRDMYYEIGNIEEDSISRYSSDEIEEYTNESGHYGPW